MQVSKLYVGNLGYDVTKSELEQLFASYGTVKEVNVIEGKGFGFVEMGSSAEAEKAKEGLDSTDFKGRNLKVDEAKPKRDSGDRERSNYRRY